MTGPNRRFDPAELRGHARGDTAPLTWVVDVGGDDHHPVGGVTVQHLDGVAGMSGHHGDAASVGQFATSQPAAGVGTAVQHDDDSACE